MELAMLFPPGIFRTSGVVLQCRCDFLQLSLPLPGNVFDDAEPDCRGKHECYDHRPAVERKRRWFPETSAVALQIFRHVVFPHFDSFKFER
jgi:hypothetical protein